MTKYRFDMYEDGERGDALEGQPQYNKYIKCHEYRIHPCTFGVTRTKGCGDTFDNGGGCGCGSGNGSQAGQGCTGPGDPGMPGAGGSFSYQEIFNDKAPCMDFEDVCTPFSYRFDMMMSNGKFDHGEITDKAPCSIGSHRGPKSICYSEGHGPEVLVDYNPNYNYNG